MKRKNSEVTNTWSVSPKGGEEEEKKKKKKRKIVMPTA